MCFHYLHVDVNRSINSSFVHLLPAVELRFRNLRYLTIEAPKEYFWSTDKNRSVFFWQNVFLRDLCITWNWKHNYSCINTQDNVPANINFHPFLTQCTVFAYVHLIQWITDILCRRAPIMSKTFELAFGDCRFSRMCWVTQYLVYAENLHVNLYFTAHDFRTITLDYRWSLVKAYLLHVR